MKRLLSLLIAICIVATPMLWAQSVGDYGSFQNGNWTTVATWVVCVTDGTWEGATAATVAPTEANNVWIRSGHSVIFDTSSKKCKDLTIESGGSLVSTSTFASPVYCSVYGSTMTINGNFGGVSDGLGLKLGGAAGQTLTLTGTGTCNIGRVQPQNANQTFIFDMDCGVNYPGGSGTGGSALYANSKDNATYTINVGKTVTIADNAYISIGTSGDSAGNLNLTIIVNGTLTCGNNSKVNLNNSTGFTSTLNINNGGVLNLGSYLRGNATNTGTVNVNVATGGTLNCTSTGTLDLSNANVAVNGSLTCAGTMDIGTKQIIGNGSFTLDAGATLKTAHPDGLDGSVIVAGTKTLNTAANYSFVGTAAQVTGSLMPLRVNDFTVNNSAGVTLSQGMTVNGTLTLTSGDLALNGNAFNYLTASGAGTISETAALNAPSAVNVGNLGAVITSGVDLGSTVVKRGFTAKTVNSNSGINRWYDITPTTNTGLNATLVFNYDETELNGLVESQLALYSSVDGGTNWICRAGTVDATNNNITLTGVDAFSMWTVGRIIGMEGIYYVGTAGTAPGSTDPLFPTLNAACDSLSNGIITGDITMYITSNLTEPVNVDLAANTNGYTVTFKPYTGITPTVTYTQTADNLGSSGAWVIGMKNTSGAPFVPTHNIIIDGSNTEAGSTRDLTFVSSLGANAYDFRIKGDCDNITIKNCIMSTTVSYGIWVNSQDNNMPDNFTVDNCSITATSTSAATPIHVALSGTNTVPMENLVIKNNDLIARHRGIHLAGKTNVTTIENNTFEVNQTSAGMLSSAVNGTTINATGTTYILGNDFKVNATAGVTATYGIRTITASGGGTFIIANNFFRGFAAPTAGGAASEIIGIRCGSTVEAYNNTFVLNNINATSGSLYRAINVAAGTPKIKNNIFVIEEDDFSAYAISGTPTSDYNNFYLKGTTNAKVHPLYATLADWQATGADLNSVSKAVEFVSADDLHLAGASLGDAALAGTPLASVMTDIDGDARSATSPYMGADEGNVVLPDRPEFNTLSLVESLDQSNWTIVPGELATGFQMVLNPVNEFQYMNLSNVTTNVPLAEGLYGFKIASHPATGFFEYWAGRGVDASATAGTWQAVAWTIINGTEPTFYIKVGSDGTKMLVDGLLHLIGAGDSYLRIEGNYLIGDYSYSGKVTSSAGAVSNPITVNIAFSNPVTKPDVFFSEYIEGSSSNKAIEIYNGTGAPVDLSQFTVKQSYGGEGWGIKGGIADSRYVLPLSGTLAAGDVYVIYNSQASASIVAVGDTGLIYNGTANGAIGSNVAAFTGDDAMGLFYNDVLIDVIGIPTVDPGTNWPVAGTGATSEFTLVRKTAVKTGNTDWAISSGTNTTDSEWEVYPQDSFGYLGEHPTTVVKPAFTTCTIDQSVDKAAWTAITGNLASGFRMTLNPAEPTEGFYYLNFGATTATNTQVKEGYYGFKIASHPAGFFEYWAGRGVFDGCTGTWEPVAWQIINGNLPTFFVKADVSGNLTLVDGLVKATGQPDEFLRIEGNYLLGAYSYTGKIMSKVDVESDTIAVRITFQEPLEIISIAQIQDTTGAANGDSKLKGQTVLTTGIVTAAKTGAYFIQDKTGPWNGIYVYDSGRVPVVGDSIVIECTVAEYYNLTELASVTKYEVIASGVTLPAPAVLTTASYKQEMWEGVLVTVDNAECVTNGGEWEVNDGSGIGRIDDLFKTYSATVGYKYKVTGPVNYSYGNFMIAPGSAADIYEYTPDVTLPLFEGATAGVLDLKWEFDPWTIDATPSLTIIDSTGSAWGSHVISYVDSSYTGIVEVANAAFSNITISSDIYIIGPADANFPLYTGLAIMADSNKYYRFIYRNSSASDNGQFKLQGYDGVNWHISKNWNPGTDFTALGTGWHNFKVTRSGNKFWAYVDDVALPGCPLSDEAPFMTKGAPGIYKYNTGVGTVLFDNFSVTEPQAVTLTIGTAIADANGDCISDMAGVNVTLTGIITSPNMSYNVNAPASANYMSCDHYMQDGTGGINIYSYTSAGFRAEFALGDSVQVTGVITTYKGKNEIVVAALADIAILGHTAIPKPREVSLANVNAETYEGQLVVVRNLHPIKLSAWPVKDSTYATNYSVYATDGSSDTVQVYIDRQTDVPLWEGLPYFNFDVVGVVSQYSSLTVPNNGYEVIPRFQTDITCHTPTVLATELNESFETVVPPTNWYSFITNLDSGLVTAAWNKGSIAPVTGTYHAYMNNFNSASNCWLVTPALNTKSEKKYLSFVAFDEVNTTAGNYGSELVVLAATESGLFADQWTEVKRITEAECIGAHPVWSVDLSTISDTNYVYIAFMVHNFGSPSNPNLGGDNWIVDDVKMVTNVGIKEEALPIKYALSQNYPNPFNPTTTIKLSLPKDANVNLKVYNLLGQEVATIQAGKMAAGYHSFMFDASRLASGVYFYRVEANGFTSLKKMTILK